MGIARKPKPKSIDDFIAAAPDSAAITTEATSSPRRTRKGAKVQITLTISESLLTRVDDKADQLGQSRAALINLAISQMLENGIKV